MKSRRQLRSLKPRVLVCADDGQAPEWILLVPAGQVTSAHGDFLCDDAAMQTVIAAFTSLERDMVVDYEHQTLTGEEAPAAGWLDTLDARADGLWAHVAWTERGRQYVASKEYRYLSPVIWVRDSDRRVIELHSVALTNDPAIHGMRPLVAKRHTIEEEDGMDVKKLLAALGLDEDASEAQAIEAAEALVLTRAGVVTVLALKADAKPTEVEARVKELVEFQTGAVELLELEDDPSPAAARGALLALKNPAGQVAAADYVALKSRMDKRDADDLVAAALKAGKVTPATQGWAEQYALQDPAGFKAFVAKAPQVVPLGTEVPPETGGGGGGLSQEELLVCKQIGLDPEAYKKHATG